MVISRVFLRDTELLSATPSLPMCPPVVQERQHLRACRHLSLRAHSHPRFCTFPCWLPDPPRQHLLYLTPSGLSACCPTATEAREGAAEAARAGAAPPLRGADAPGGGEAACGTRAGTAGTRGPAGGQPSCELQHQGMNGS